jgi:hypothetical protein
MIHLCLIETLADYFLAEGAVSFQLNRINAN